MQDDHAAVIDLIDAFVSGRPALGRAIEEAIHDKAGGGRTFLFEAEDIGEAKVLRILFPHGIAFLLRRTGGEFSSRWGVGRNRDYVLKELGQWARERTGRAPSDPRRILARIIAKGRPDSDVNGLWKVMAKNELGPARVVGAEAVEEAIRALDILDDEGVLACVRRSLGKFRDAGAPASVLLDAFMARRGRRFMRMLEDVVPADRMALLTRVLGPAPTFADEGPEAVALRSCLVVPRPDWQVQALAAAPVLTYLHLVPPPDGSRGHRLAEEIGNGGSVGSVVRSLVRDLLGRRPGDDEIPPVVVRSVVRVASLAEALCTTSPDDVRTAIHPTPATSCLRAMLAFFRRNPGHRPLAPGEVDELQALFRRWVDGIDHLALDDEGMSRVVRCMMDRSGRVGRVPDGFRDAAVSVRASIAALVACALPDLDAEPNGPFVSAVFGHVVLPARRGLAGLRAFDATWHVGAPTFARDLAHIRADVIARTSRKEGRDVLMAADFPHVVDGPFTVDGIEIRPLRTKDSFAREGLEMGHCVAVRDGAARRGEIVVFSLVSSSGERSTAACRIGVDKRSLVTGEHRGPGNADPSASHVAALAKMLGNLDDLDDRIDALRKAAGERSTLYDEPRFDPATMDDDERQAWMALHFANIRPHVEEAEKALGPRAWIERMAASFEAPHATAPPAYEDRARRHRGTGSREVGGLKWMLAITILFLLGRIDDD